MVTIKRMSKCVVKQFNFSIMKNMLKFIHPQFYPVNTILINIRHIKLYFIISAQNTKLVARHLTIVNCEMNCFYIEFQTNQIKTIYLCAVNVQFLFWFTLIRMQFAVKTN